MICYDYETTTQNHSNVYAYAHVYRNSCISADSTGSAETICSPRIKKGTTSSNSINISWRQQDNISGYQIYRATAYDGKYKRIKNVAAGNQAFCNMKLKSGREYFYKVRAYVSTDSGTLNGKFSKKFLLIPKAVPAQPM